MVSVRVIFQHPASVNLWFEGGQNWSAWMPDRSNPAKFKTGNLKTDLKTME